jgi:hypothetical protein
VLSWCHSGCPALACAASKHTKAALKQRQSEWTRRHAAGSYDSHIATAAALKAIPPLAQCHSSTTNFRPCVRACVHMALL